MHLLEPVARSVPLAMALTTFQYLRTALGQSPTLICQLAVYEFTVPYGGGYLQYTGSERTPQTTQQIPQASFLSCSPRRQQSQCELTSAPMQVRGCDRTGCRTLIFTEHLLCDTLHLQSFPLVISFNAYREIYGSINGQSAAFS